MRATRMYLTLLVLAATTLLGACSTVTSPETNTLPDADRQRVSPLLAQNQKSDQKTLKRKVAIAPFTNETRHGNASVLDSNNDRVGNQAMDILSARLTETDRFLMLERADLDKIRSEKQLAGLSQELIGADFLIVGSISEFGRSAESEVGIFSRNKIQTARTKVKVRLLNVKTGQIIYAEEGTGLASAEANSNFGAGKRASYDASLDDKAISAAFSQLINNLINSLLDQPWRAYVVGKQDGSYLVTGGPSQGLRIGDVLDVMKAGQQVRNLQTGLLLELPGKKVASIEIAAFVGEGDNELAVADIVSGSIPEASVKPGEFYVVGSTATAGQSK